MLGAVLLVSASLAQLLIQGLLFSSPGALGEGADVVLYGRAGLGLLGRALLALGLIGLYVRQSGATGIPGLIGFLITFFGLALPVGFEWSGVLTALGWTLFGAISLQAGIYPRTPAVLLIAGAVIAGVLNYFLAALLISSVLVYVIAAAEIVRNAAAGWLGYALFRIER